MKKAINWLNMVGKLNIIFDTKIWIVNKKKNYLRKSICLPIVWKLIPNSSDL